MKIQEKPDYLIFADSAKNGECTNFPDVSRGWGVTIDQTASKPPLEWMNGAFNRIDKNALYLLQQGVPEWSETVIYPVNAIIKYNGVLYTAIVENDNAIPTTSNKWKKTIAETPNASTTQKGIVKLSSDTNSTSETEAATPKAVKVAYDAALNANNIATTAVQKGQEYPFHGYLGDRRLNDLGATSFGIYYQNSYANALIERGYPIQEAGALSVLKTEGDGNEGCVQVYTIYKSGRQFIRNYRGSNTSGYWENWIEQITTANINTHIPAGVPLAWPTNKPPEGWLECNGSWFDKNQFPKLAAAYPNGSLPDLRGVFIRGKDNGRGLDPNRAILSYQDDAIRNIYGEISPISESFAADPIASGAFRYFEKHAGHTPSHIDVGSVGGVTFDASRVVATANENRPRNIAFMYIVKAE